MKFSFSPPRAHFCLPSSQTTAITNLPSFKFTLLPTPYMWCSVCICLLLDICCMIQKVPEYLQCILISNLHFLPHVLFLRATFVRITYFGAKWYWFCLYVTYSMYLCCYIYSLPISGHLGYVIVLPLVKSALYKCAGHRQKAYPRVSVWKQNCWVIAQLYGQDVASQPTQMFLSFASSSLP